MNFSRPLASLIMAVAIVICILILPNAQDHTPLPPRRSP